jgi:hypothetical protein
MEGAVIIKLNKYEYEFLKGNENSLTGSALMAVHDFCQELGFGRFGAPTPFGIKCMDQYERENLGSR